EPGKGPGEYIRLWDFFIDKTKNRVAIFDQSQAKIIEYSYDGEFLNEFHVRCCPTEVKKIKDSYYFSDVSMAVDTIIHEYNGNDIINSITKKDLCLEEYTEHVLHRQSLTMFDDSITYWTELNNYVFRIKDGKVLKRYLFDYGKYSYEIKKSKDANQDLSRYESHGTVERFIETKNYIFINSGFKNYAKHILYDKKTKLASVVDNQICNRNPFFNNFSFVNTKDGLVNFWPDIDGKINDTMLYQTFYAYNFKESNFCDPEGEVQKSKNIQLQKIIDESSDTDNPVIMIITLKQ
ncbi:MAG: 6-bladed beta-propeller, partial [Bacteroidales bacterium]|nr:6-bladed beta-propeller [Bacteroidales bacterium]